MFYENELATITLARPITHPKLYWLCVRLDDCDGSEDYLRVMRKIARIDDPQVIEVFAALLDSPGVVGRTAMKYLVRRGPAVLPEMRRVLDTSLDADALDRANTVIERIDRALIRLARIKERGRAGHAA
jgi:hypothetical protein